METFQREKQVKRKKKNLPVTKHGLEMDDHSLFMWGEVPVFDSWPEVVCPSQPAALVTSQQTYTIQERIKDKCQRNTFHSLK